MVSNGGPCIVCGDEGHHVDHGAEIVGDVEYDSVGAPEVVSPTFLCCIHCTHPYPAIHVGPCILCGQGQPNGDDQ